MMDVKAQFFSLTPDRVLDAVEAGGTRVTGLCYPLNSLENRVYELEREDRSRIVAKFYRPLRWSREAILEEHRFLAELIEAEIPVCAPLAFPDGSTLKEVPHTPIWYALFPRVGGRAPEELSDEQLARLGRLLARIHQVGAAREAPARPSLTPDRYGTDSLEILAHSRLIPRDLLPGVLERGRTFVNATRPLFEGVAYHRTHGDCHLGNLLWGSAGPFFLDFDDALHAPAVQDVWLLTPGRDAEARAQREVFLRGYSELRGFERRQLHLIEALRGLRYLRYAAWIAQRWDDPSFQHAFAHVTAPRYWQELQADLGEQTALVQEDLRALQLSGGSQTTPRGPAPPPSWKPTGTAVEPSPSRPEAHRFQQNTLERSSPPGGGLEGADSTSAPSSTSLEAGSRFPLRRVRVGEEDWQRILAIRTEVYVEELERDIDLELDGRDRESFQLLALTVEGRAGGTLRYRLGEGTLEVDRLAVLYPHRRKGIGTALVEAAVRLAGEARLKAVQVALPETEVAAARAFLQHRGFSGEGTTLTRKVRG